MAFEAVRAQVRSFFRRAALRNGDGGVTGERCRRWPALGRQVMLSDQYLQCTFGT